MEARVEKAAGMNCDAIEPDNMSVSCGLPRGSVHFREQENMRACSTYTPRPFPTSLSILASFSVSVSLRVMHAWLDDRRDVTTLLLSLLLLMAPCPELEPERHRFCDHEGRADRLQPVVRRVGECCEGNCTRNTPQEQTRALEAAACVAKDSKMLLISVPSQQKR